jgi:hypothetical protein
MRSAIVENGAVVNVIVGEIEGSIPVGDDVGIGWAFKNGKFTAPTQPDPEPVDPNYTISKATVFRRTTSQEAEALDGMIADTDARTRNIYMGAQYLDTRDELWPMLRSIMVGAFGEERTDELLAREEGT